MPLGILPGEWDWMQRQGGIFGMPTLSPGGAAIPPSSTVQGGIFGKFANKLHEGVTKMGSDPTSQLGLRILANSGYSQKKRGLGEILGGSVLQNQEATQQLSQDKIREEYMRAQIGAMNRPQARKPIAVAGPDGKPVYVAEDEAIGKSPYAEPAKAGVPNDIQEYEYAVKNGFKGSILDYQRKKSEVTRAPASQDSRYYNTARGLFEVGADGQPKLVPGTDPTGSSGRPLPAGLADDLKGNAQVIGMIDEALPQLSTPAGQKATGARNAVINMLTPDAISDNVKNVVNPDGTELRALVTNLNSFVVKQRNGAAVTVSEFARQRGYLPSDSDPTDVLQTKLTKLKQALQKENVFIGDFAESQGYRRPPAGLNGLTIHPTGSPEDVAARGAESGATHVFDPASGRIVPRGQ